MALAGTSAKAMTCDSLAALKLPDTTIASATQTGPFSSTDPMFGPFEVKSAFCKVSGTIAPAIKFQVWLPLKEHWNGKLQGVGNGGVAGSITEGSLSAALARNYAAVSSNLGHDGNAIDFSFAIGHPELVADWGHRATHVMTVAAKAIVAATTYFDKPDVIADVSAGLGPAMRGLDVAGMPREELLSTRGW